MGLWDTVKGGAKIVGAGIAAPVAGIAAGGKALWDAGSGFANDLGNDAAAKMPNIQLEATPGMNADARRGVGEQLNQASRGADAFAGDITEGSAQAGLQPQGGGLINDGGLSDALSKRAQAASSRSMGRINVDAAQKGLDRKAEALKTAGGYQNRQEDAQLARSAFGRAQKRRAEIEHNNREAARNGAIGSVLGIAGAGAGALLGGSGGPEGAAKGMAAGSNLSQATGNTQMTGMSR